MTFSMTYFGSNSGHFSPAALKKLGCGLIETSLGKQQPYLKMREKNISDLEAAKALGMNYTIHLPVYLPEVWLENYDFYDGFYLDPDEGMRALSFEVLEMNLKQLAHEFKPLYYVIHFPGIYPESTAYENFEDILEQSLVRLNQLAIQYEVTLALEYFGTNARFADYRHWIQALSPYTRIRPLLDTGHLYFNCYRNGFSYDEVLYGLAPHCIGFHVWNVLGEGFYDESKSYKAYHHIAPHPEQKRLDGWAFEPETVLPYLAQFNQPILVEAGQVYKGADYFVESLVKVEELLRNLG